MAACGSCAGSTRPTMEASTRLSRTKATGTAMARRTRWTPVRPAIDSVQEEQGTCPHDIDMEPSPHCCCGRYPWRAWHRLSNQIGRASGRERGVKYGWIWVVAGQIKKK